MDIYRFIRKMPVFKHCSVKERKLLAKLNKFLVTFKKGDFIIKQGFKSRTALPLYIIVNGSVLIKKRGVIKPLATLKAGSTFGEMSFLSKHPRTTNVIANEEVLVIKMNNHFFSAIPKNLKDKIKDYLIEVLIERLNNMNESFGKISNKEFSTKARKTWFK
ncbi:MAG TPA: cyclic nucleotide-binding domain-containing protein [Nitrospinota bacterium]|nr:cyclic nucleotide-binding domain-containing protein [Nitrospinota bacterium]